MKRVLSCALSLLIIISSFTGVGMPEHVRAQAVEGSISAVLRLQYWLNSEPVTINGPGEYTFKIDNLVDRLNCGLKLYNEAEKDGINGIHIEDASPLGADNAQYSLLQYYSVITKSVRINGRECELIPDKQGVTVPKNVAGGREKFSLSYVNAGWMDGTGIKIPEPISDGEKLSSVEIVIEVSDYMQPNIKLPTAPEGYEIAYMHDMRDIDLTPTWQETHTNDASNAAIAEALKKDGAYVEFIGAYPRANSGWIRFELSDNTDFLYATYDSSEIKPTVRTENENSILTVGNDVVADALKRAEEKGVTITGVNQVCLNYNNSDGSTDEEEARKSKCVCLVVYSELPPGVVYTSENGSTPNTSKAAYGFFVVGGNVWGEDSCCGISAERMREYFRDGEYNLSFVFGGTPGDSAPLAVINGGFDTHVEMTVKELGDGRHEATIPLQSVLDGYGVTAEEVNGLCVQTLVENFALYKIRLYKPETEPEPDEPCTHPEESREWKSDAENHWQVCKKCGEEVPETKKPHDALTYEELDSEKHTVKCSTCGYSGEEEHSWDGGKTVEATETEKGYILYTCEKCKAEKKVETAHVHNGGEEWVTDETSHWHKCTLAGCDYDGGIYGKASHTYVNGVCTVCGYKHENHTPKAGTYKSNGDTHTYVCDVCGATVAEAHTAGKQDHDADSHWTVCTECGAHIGEAEHSFEYVSDGASGHHRKCSVCNYETETAAHSAAPADGKYTDSEDGETHTYLCAECGYSVSEKHRYSDWEYSDVDYHVAVCKCGAEKKEAHDYVYTEDTVTETHHWTVCSVCNHETEPQDHHYEGDSDRCSDCDYWNHQHQLEWRSDGTQHWQECTEAGCGFVTGKEEHSFGETTANETSHVQTCSKCGMTVVQKHQFEGYSFNAGMHWHECTVCHYKTDYDVHVLTDAHDATSHWQECSVCDYEADHKAHTPSAEYGKDDTQHWSVCTECGAEYNKSEHTIADDYKHDADSHWKYCEVCGKEETKSDHVWDNGKVTVEPTETTEGEKLFTCTECGEIKTEAVPKSSHTHVAGEEWKSDEKTHWHECVSETCDNKSEKLDEAEHVWDDGKVTVEPTYTKEGEKLYTCEVCGETKTEIVPVKGHEHSTVTKFDENGHWEECTICSETVGEVEAHTPGEWITDSEATSTEEGKRHKECTVCGYVTDVLEVPATGDIDVEVPTVGNVPKVELPAEQQEVLKNAIIDEEDVEAIESGASIDIELTVENAESTIAPEDKAKSDEAAAQGSYTHVRYLDINLAKVVTDASGVSTSEEVSELGKEVRIVITVPLALAKPTGRDFAVIRVHDGEATVLKDLDSDPNTVTISTNLFSSYTLVYVDTTPVPSTPGGIIGHAHVITGLQNDAHYHWRGCFICSMRVDYEPHRFINGVCTVCGYRDPDYVPEVEEEEPAEEAPDTEVTVVDAPAEGTEQGGDSEGTPEVTDTPANLPETEAEVVEVKEDDETSENPKTGVVFTGIGAVMAAIAALIAKRK